MFSPHQKAGALPFSRSLREGGASTLGRGGEPLDTFQTARGDVLSSVIQSPLRIVPRSHSAVRCSTSNHQEPRPARVALG